MTSLTDSARSLEHLEARVTLLERKLARLQSETSQFSETGNSLNQKEFHFACNSPDLLIANVYPVEFDSGMNMNFCWVGNDGPLQFIFPIRPISKSLCQMRFAPHSAVDMHKMIIIVNDGIVATNIHLDGGLLEVAFEIPPSRTTEISVVVTNVDSVRPSETGENSDIRLLAARFFGADIVFETV